MELIEFSTIRMRNNLQRRRLSNALNQTNIQHHYEKESIADKESREIATIRGLILLNVLLWVSGLIALYNMG